MIFAANGLKQPANRVSFAAIQFKEKFK